MTELTIGHFIFFSVFCPLFSVFRNKGVVYRILGNKKSKQKIDWTEVCYERKELNWSPGTSTVCGL
jgi:hypothetical protein